MEYLARFLRALLCACIVQIGVLCVVVECDPWVAQYVAESICQRLSVFGDCVFSARVRSCSLLRGTLILRNVQVRPKEGSDWYYTIDELRVSWPWAPVIANRTFLLHTVCPQMELTTQGDAQGLAIQEHIRACLANGPQYFVYQPIYVRIDKLLVNGHSADNNVTGMVDATLELAHSLDAHTVTLQVKDGYISVRGKKVLTQLAGVGKHTGADGAVFEGAAQVSLGEKFEHIAGRVQATDTAVDFSVYNNDRSLRVAGAYGDYLKVIVNVLLPTGLPLTLSLSGDTFSLAGSQGKQYLDGTWCYAEQVLSAVGTTPRGLEVRLAVGHDGAYTLTGETKLLTDVGLLDPRVTIDSSLELTGNLRNPLTTKIVVHNNHIQAATTYLFLPEISLQVAVDPHDTSVRITDFVCTTQQGSVTCDAATIRYDNQQVTCVHAPLLMNNLFVHRGSDFYATVSGDLIVTVDRAARSSLKGRCCIDQCHVRENIFSSDAKQGLMLPGLLAQVPCADTTDLDIALTSKTPIEVKTSFLQAQCMVNVQLRGTVAQPELYGSIDCIEGKLMFPYQPMHIVQGKIYFVDNQLEDPILEITARARIKNYTILLQISGTAQQPTITFQSSPSLQDEQIISLLFGGVEDGAVAIAMPLSLSDSLERLLLGSADESSQVLMGLERILKPLSNVRIVPSFSDQSARGGVRGALRVEVNDRLSGLIQQNFSLTEDTLIEAAYKVTDNVTIRGMRDERGDLGGEVEVSLNW